MKTGKRKMAISAAAGMMSPYKHIAKRPMRSIVFLVMAILIIAADISLSRRLIAYISDEFLKLAMFVVSAISFLLDIGAAKRSFARATGYVWGRLSVILACAVLSVTAAMIAAFLNDNLIGIFVLLASFIRFFTPKQKVYATLIAVVVIGIVSCVLMFFIPGSESALEYAGDFADKIVPSARESIETAISYIKERWST